MPEIKRESSNGYAPFWAIEIKDAADEGNFHVIRGIATSGTVDRVGDIVDPLGVKVAADIPLFMHHDSRESVGRAKLGKATKAGIPFEARLPKVAEAGVLRDRIDEAWQSVKYGLITGVSIGFRVLNDAYEAIKDGGYRFLETEILELSLVPIPAQPDAVIQGFRGLDQSAQITIFKSIDQEVRRTAHGAHGERPPAGNGSSPVASGTPKQPASGGFSFSRTRGTAMKTMQELREERTQKAARLTELMELRTAEKRRFTEDEAKEFDTLTNDVAELDDDIRVKQYEETNAKAATAVQGKSFAEGSASRGAIIVKKTDPDDKFKGQGFTRAAVAKALSYCSMREGNFMTPGEIAEKRWGKSHPNLVQYIKTGVAGGGTGSGEWGAELAQSDTRYSGDFLEFLYAATVFDRLPLRSVPARVHIKGQDGAATGSWVGESKGGPVTKPDFSSVELTPLKVMAIAVCSKELIADSDPSAEMWIRDSIVQAIAQRVDTTFVSATAASNGVSPAGLLNGLAAGVPSGTDAAAVRADIQTLYSGFLTAKNASGLYHVMTPSMAKAISLMRNALGQKEFEGLNSTGGTLEGDPVVTGDNLTSGNWLLLKPSDIWKIGDTGIDLSMSDQATIEQDTAPQGASDTPVAASATLMSLWQTESVGFKVVRRINYAKRRTGAVAYIADGEYGGVFS